MLPSGAARRKEGHATRRALQPGRFPEDAPSHVAVSGVWQRKAFLVQSHKRLKNLKHNCVAKAVLLLYVEKSGM